MNPIVIYFDNAIIKKKERKGWVFWSLLLMQSYISEDLIRKYKGLFKCELFFLYSQWRMGKGISYSFGQGLGILLSIFCLISLITFCCCI